MEQGLDLDLGSFLQLLSPADAWWASLKCDFAKGVLTGAYLLASVGVCRLILPSPCRVR